MQFENVSGLPDDFSGVVRLFPLPNLVLFPGAVTPLHVFEPRYRALLEDAVAGDGLIAMSLLAPGWESDYEGRPDVFPIVCVGRVLSHTELDGGRYNLLLLGVQRALLTGELPPDRPFRTADVALLEDRYTAAGAATRGKTRRRLLDVFREYVPDSPEAKEQFEQLATAEVPLGALTDIMAWSLGFGVEFKQQLLAECDVDRRAELLLEQVAAGDMDDGGFQRNFPPEFSEN